MSEAFWKTNPLQFSYNLLVFLFVFFFANTFRQSFECDDTKINSKNYNLNAYFVFEILIE